MQEIAFATDTQLKNVAQYCARNEFANSKKRKAEKKFANMIPIVDSFLYGATSKGKLSTKIMAGGGQLKDWGIFIAATELYNKAINKIVDKSETLQNFRENSPVMFGVANTALGVTTGISAIKWVNVFGRKFILPYIPKNIKNFAKSFIKSTDTGRVGKAINSGMKKFAQKHQTSTKVLGTIGKWALPLLCLGYITSLVFDVCKAKSKEDKIYNNLKEARLAAAQQLAAKVVEDKE